VKAYQKLGDLLAQCGDHKESEFYYAKIIRKQTGQQIVREEELLPAWGREMFFAIDDPLGKFTYKEARDYSELEIFAMRESVEKKKVNSTLALLRDVYKLTRKGRGKGRAKVF
jgi:hypothetical protein